MNSLSVSGIPYFFSRALIYLAASYPSILGMKRSMRMMSNIFFCLRKSSTIYTPSTPSAPILYSTPTVLHKTSIVFLMNSLSSTTKIHYLLFSEIFSFYPLE